MGRRDHPESKHKSTTTFSYLRIILQITILNYLLLFYCNTRPPSIHCFNFNLKILFVDAQFDPSFKL